MAAKTQVIAVCDASELKSGQMCVFLAAMLHLALETARLNPPKPYVYLGTCRHHARCHLPSTFHRKQVDFGEKGKVLLSKIGNDIYATSAFCTHYGAPLESEPQPSLNAVVSSVH